MTYSVVCIELFAKHETPDRFQQQTLWLRILCSGTDGREKVKLRKFKPPLILCTHLQMASAAARNKVLSARSAPDPAHSAQGDMCRSIHWLLPCRLNNRHHWCAAQIFITWPRCNLLQHQLNYTMSNMMWILQWYPMLCYEFFLFPHWKPQGNHRKKNNQPYNQILSFTTRNRLHP